MVAARKTRTRRRRRSWLWRWRRALFLAGLLGATALVGAAWLISRIPLPPASPQPQTTFLTDSHGAPLARLTGGENRVPVSIDRVPKVVWEGVVATEDRSFFRHGGVDPLGVLRATWADLRHGSAVQGGSTITQQYVKNEYVGRQRTLLRKLREAVIAVKLEHKYSKRQILELYLNTIYFGRGAYGIEAGAQAWFGKDVSQLGLPEAAYLAGIIRAPVTSDVTTDAQQARLARSRALVAMVRSQVITPDQRSQVERLPIAGYTLPRTTPASSTYLVPDSATQYFVDYVRGELVRGYGEDTVLRGGLRVETTLDLRLQGMAHRAVCATLNRPGDPSGALVALDADGRVVAMVGGCDWGVSKVNLAVGSAGGGSGRQAGSAFKPLVLAETVREGYTVESALAGPAHLTIPNADRGRDWQVSNFDGESFGRLNLIDATALSVNSIYAQVITDIGPARVVELAHRLGITSRLDPVGSVTLGTQDVSVLEMADAYLTFANEGVQVNPRAILRVSLADGTVLENDPPVRSRALTSDQADTVNYVLRQVVERGTGTGAQTGKPLAGKTGTTDNYGDAWFVGYTRQLTAAVWMGYPAGQSRPLLGVHGVAKVSGGTLPAQIFRQFMTAASKGIDTGDFATPASFPGRTLPDAGRIAVETTPTTGPVPSSAPTTSTTAGLRSAPTSAAPRGPSPTSVAPVTTRPRGPPTTR